MRKFRVILAIFATLGSVAMASAQLASNEGFNLIVVGDPQPQTKAQLRELEQVIIPQIATIVEEYKAQSDRPTAILLTGDVVWDTIRFLPRVKSAFESLGVEVFAVIGNHDHNRAFFRKDARAERPYVKTFGSRNQCFMLGETLFVTLDNIMFNPNKTYCEEVDGEQLAWLESVMADHTEAKRVAVCMHASATDFRDETIKPYAQPIVDIVGDRELHFVTGHRHRHNTADHSAKLYEHSVAQVSGNLWFAPICSDGMPRGVFCIEERDGEWRWHHRMLGRGADQRLVIWREGQVEGSEEYVVVKVVGWDDKWRVEWSENGVKMGAMEQVEMYDPDYMHYVEYEADYGKKYMERLRRSATLRSHYYRLRRSTKNSEITITATDRFGRKFEAKL